MDPNQWDEQMTRQAAGKLAGGAKPDDVEADLRAAAHTRPGKPANNSDLKRIMKKAWVYIDIVV